MSTAPEQQEVIHEQAPLAYPAAARALAGCLAGTARLIRQRRMHLPAERVGMRLRFADGTTARVFRETAVDQAGPADPCVLVVEFRLEQVLAEALADRGVEVERGTELVSVRDGPSRARAILRSSAGTEEAWFGFVAGCDGPASTVRA